MTSVRMSFVFAPEDEFKGGKSNGIEWIAPPPGSYFSSTGTRQTSAIYTTGSKKWETTAYGAYSGTWDWTFMLDYYYLEPFVLAFDKVYIDGDMEFPIEWHSFKNYNAYQGTSFKFVKGKTGRVPSFTVRRKISHTIAGGSVDEMVELKGCVVNTISFSRSASTSQYQVQMSGTYADEKMYLGSLPDLDYKEYEGELVEYSCVAIADNSAAVIGNATYVANTDSVSISIQNNTNMIYNTCTPFATQYYEDRNQFQISTSCYSTNPTAYKTRMYSGGSDNTHRAPMSKGLKPLGKMFIASFNGTIDPDDLDIDGTKLSNAFENSENNILFEVSDLVVKSMKWVNGDGSKLTDTLSSVDCKDISFTVKRMATLGTHGPNSSKLFFNIFRDSSDMQ